MAVNDPPNWNSFGRANASEKWRKQSAAMGSGFTQAIVEAAQVQSGMRVLDVACGTGEPGISLAALASPGEVVGIDISEGPLEIARRRAAQRDLRNIEFQQADAHNLPFPENSFDRVTSRLGVMFFADLGKALPEMYRVLKPNGLVALLAWGPMDQPYFSSTIGNVLRKIPGSSLPESGKKMFAFSHPGLLTAKLRAAGFQAVEERFSTLPWTWPGRPEEVWQYFQEVTVPFAPLLKSIPEERRAELDSEITTAISRFYDGTKVRFTATANITCARK